MTRQAHCAECGAAFTPRRLEGVFCSARCRKAFNNRRMQRGAELYDLVMAWRFEREEAAQRGVLKRIARLASDFRERDHDERAGRKSWRPARLVLARRPDLAATFRGVMTNGRPRR